MVEYMWTMRQVPLERDINIAVNGCSGFATSTQKGPFMAMLISCSRGTYPICDKFANMHVTFISVLCSTIAKGVSDSLEQ